MKSYPLRPSPCGETIFLSKGLLILLDDLISNVVIIHISSARRNHSGISINFVLLMVSKTEVTSIAAIMISSWNF